MEKERLISLFGEEWYECLNETIFETDYWLALLRQIVSERRYKTVYPEKKEGTIFKAFRTTPLSKVRVIVLGQDPYHDGSFDGFAFSNKGKTKLSPSLRNIFKEVEDDIYGGLKLDQDPDLERWAKQGVLLTNVAHTVVKGTPNSHYPLWTPFTLEVITQIRKLETPVVWFLWGKQAQFVFSQCAVSNDSQLVLKASHPAAEIYNKNAGFFGCKHFSKANEFIKEEIIW